MDTTEPYPRLMGNKSSHALRLQQHLYDQMCSSSDYCDVTLVCGGIEIRAHWCVLVSCQYFQSLFYSGMKEKRDGKIIFTVGNPVAVRKAITYLYTGNTEISWSDVNEILEVADYLQMDDLKSTCASYLSSVEITTQNCVFLTLLASQYNLDIYFTVYDFMRAHLLELMTRDDILSISADSVLCIIQDPYLNYISVEDFFTFLVKWVQHDMDLRLQYFEDFFCELDLKKTSRVFLEKTVEVPLVLNSDKCKLYVLKFKLKHMTGLLHDEPNTDVVLVVGGCSLGEHFSPFFASPFFPVSDWMMVDHIFGYVISEDRWTELAPLPYKMQNPYVTYNPTNTCLFVYDSSSGTTTTGGVETIGVFQYNVTEKVWTSPRFPVPAPYEDITVHNIFVCNNSMYLLASGASQGTSVESHDWQVFVFKVSEDWSTSTIIRTLFARSIQTTITSCVVNGRYICVLGKKCRPDVQPYRARNTRFFCIDSRNDELFEASKGVLQETLMIPHKDQLILTRAGFHKHGVFNFSNRRWKTVKGVFLPNPPKDVARKEFVFTVHNSQVFMFGGKTDRKNKATALASVFDINTRKWSNVSELPKAMSDSGITVAKLPKDRVRCHIDCLHCKYQVARMQAVYHIDYPVEDDDDDDDDDGDMSYEDEEIYSDFWDDNDYDLAPYDWF